MVVFCLKIMPVAKRKYFEFLKSNKLAGAPQPDMHFGNKTGVLFMYKCLWTFKYTHLQGSLPFGFFTDAFSLLCRLRLIL
jgi:hypothetical protein